MEHFDVIHWGPKHNQDISFPSLLSNSFPLKSHIGELETNAIIQPRFILGAMKGWSPMSSCLQKQSLSNSEC